MTVNAGADGNDDDDDDAAEGGDDDEASVAGRVLLPERFDITIARWIAAVAIN